MAKKQWDKKGPGGEIVYWDEDKGLLIVESGTDEIRIGCWADRWPKPAAKNKGWYIFHHVEIPETQRTTDDKGEVQHWADSAEVPIPFSAWPEELQLSVAKWILSAVGPEELTSVLSVASVSTRHKFQRGFYIHLNVPEGVVDLWKS